MEETYTTESEEVEEEFLSGFCKMQNQGRMVICEVRRRLDGTKEILSSDCAWGKCEHTGTCQLMNQLAQQ